jgi:ankyrin repeat protein
LNFFFFFSSISNHHSTMRHSVNDVPVATLNRELMLCSRDGCINGITALLDAKADVNCRIVIPNEPPPITKVTMSNRPIDQDLALCYNNHCEVTAQLLIDANADVGACIDIADADPVIVAAAQAAAAPVEAAPMLPPADAFAEQVVMARMMLEGGADPNTPDNAGETPIFKCHSTEMVQLLLEFKADIEHVNNAAETPLMDYIRHSPASAIIMTLLEANANTDNVTYCPVYHPPAVVAALMQHNATIVNM